MTEWGTGGMTREKTSGLRKSCPSNAPSITNPIQTVLDLFRENFCIASQTGDILGTRLICFKVQLFLTSVPDEEKGQATYS